MGGCGRSPRALQGSGHYPLRVALSPRHTTAAGSVRDNRPALPRRRSTTSGARVAVTGPLGAPALHCRMYDPLQVRIGYPWSPIPVRSADPSARGLVPGHSESLVAEPPVQPCKSPPPPQPEEGHLAPLPRRRMDRPVVDPVEPLRPSASVLTLSGPGQSETRTGTAAPKLETPARLPYRATSTTTEMRNPSGAERSALSSQARHERIEVGLQDGFIT